MSINYGLPTPKPFQHSLLVFFWDSGTTGTIGKNLSVTQLLMETSSLELGI